LQANLFSIEGGPIGQFKFITHKISLPISHRVHTEVSQEGTVWAPSTGCKKIITGLCKYKEVTIISGAVCIDHVHLSVSIPPKISISNFIGYLKGKSTLMLYDRHPDLQSKWDKAFWARGYYVETIGTVTEAAIKKYIEEQSDESRKEEKVPLHSEPPTRLQHPVFWRRQ
jgi:putative transposase